MRIVLSLLSFLFISAAYVCAQDYRPHRAPPHGSLPFSADSNMDDDSDTSKDDLSSSFHVPFDDPPLEDDSADSNDNDRNEVNINFSKMKDSSEEFRRWSSELSDERRMALDSSELATPSSEPISIETTTPLTNFTSGPTIQSPEKLPTI